MSTHSRKRKWNHRADYIVVGLGAAGSVITRRIADSGKSVIAFEAGPNLSNDPLVLTPSTVVDFLPAYKNMVYNQKYAETSFVMDIPNSTVGQVFEQHSGGRMWGGSTAHNAQQGVRGSDDVYDQWATEIGKPYGTGLWSYNGLLPYFKKLESFAVLPSNPYGNGSGITIDTIQRGTDGPIKYTQDYTIPTSNIIPLPPTLPPLVNTFFDIISPFTGATTSTTGSPGNYMVSGDDYNISQNKLGAFLQQRNVTSELNPAERKRSFSIAYLPPSVVSSSGRGVHNKLRIYSNSTVVKVIFKGTKAIGVLYIKDGVSKYARARKEVILCAGAIHTPAILQRSGVGDANVLSAAGKKKIVVDNPNVGRNLSCHYGTYARFPCPYGVPFIALGFTAAQIFCDGTKSPNYGSGFTSGDRRFQLFMNIASTENLQISNNQTPAPNPIDSSSPYAIANGDPNNGQSFFTFLETLCWNLRPNSKGTVLINTKDPFQLPTINYGFYSDSDELKNGNTNDITASAAMLDIVNTFCNAVNTTLPGSNVIMQNPPPLNIIGNGMPANDPVNIQQNTVAKDTIKSQLTIPDVNPWHPTGTCRMASSAESGVVNRKLKVFGCSHLRVADNSIVPIIPTGNTVTVAYVIGEVCASLILD